VHDSAAADDEGDFPSCLLCTEPLRVVAFGACNHASCCEKCMLRLRMCYQNYACPMCKQPKDAIVIAPWREDLPDFAEYAASRQPASRVMHQLGNGVVYVDKYDARRAGEARDHDGDGDGGDATDARPSTSGSMLLNRVLNYVGRSCPCCRANSANLRINKTFKSNAALLEHLRAHHPDKHMCRMCLEEGRVFALDQTVYSMAGLKAHKRAAHPACKFCRGVTFYDADGLFYHMVDAHFQCQLCLREERAGARERDAWFRNAPELQLHLANDHFACEHEVCRGALVAFLTLEELQKHIIDQHSGRMGRWNPQNSRRLDVDYRFSNSNSSGTSRRVDFQRESRGGLEVIDDHDFSAFPSLTSGTSTSGTTMTAAFPSLPTATSATVSLSRMSLGGRARTEEQFPSLGGGGVGGGPSTTTTTSTSTGPGRSDASRPRALVSVRVKCECGRKKASRVIEEGDPVPKLACDGICRLEGAKEDRKKQLDDAFGIESSSHTSRFERRQVQWDGDPRRAPLLQAAKADVALIKDYEALLEEFLKSPAARKVLAPAPKKHRMVLHHMAECYGLSSVSLGAEPNRSIQLFKPLAAVSRSAPVLGSSSSSLMTTATANNKAGLPNVLLSQYIASVTAQEIEALVQASRGYQIRFTDVATTADLSHYIRSNLSDYGVDVDNDAFTLAWDDDLKTSCTASFKSAALVSAIRERLQGGIRGVFRIDYL